MPRRRPNKPRLLRVGLVSLYNRKQKAAIKYMYRRVGKNANERYSFRWQPQFRPNNNTDSEYLKKRLFSWSVKYRSDNGLLPQSTTEANWSKKHRDNPDWRAAHYFWSYRSREFELRMDAETQDTESFMETIASFYQKYMRQANLPKQAEMAFKDLIRKINTSMGREVEINTKTVIQSSDGATSRSNEESLIYLAPHLNKKRFKEDKDGKRIAKLITSRVPTKGRPQQLDVRGGTAEAKIIENFLKSKEKEIITEGQAFSKSVFTKIDRGADVTEKPLVARWGDGLTTLDTQRINKIKTMSKSQKYAEYKKIIQEVKDNLNSIDLGGESKRRLSGEGEAKGGSYMFFIPTGAGDLLAFKIAGDGSRPIVRGAIIPDVAENLGVASVTHMLGADLTARAMKVISVSGKANTVIVGSSITEYRSNVAKRLLFMNDGVGGTSRPFAPSYHTSIIPDRQFTAALADIVEDAFGAYYNNGVWQDFFDPQSQYSINNAFRMWANEWINKSKALEAGVDKLARGDVDWKSWMKGKVKPKPSPYSWSHPVHIRPFLLTDKTGTKQYMASRMTPQGQFKTPLEGYKDNLSRL